jgi:hypothetical protein
MTEFTSREQWVIHQRELRQAAKLASEQRVTDGNPATESATK